VRRNDSALPSRTRDAEFAGTEQAAAFTLASDSRAVAINEKVAELKAGK